jgi:hypothetical protein
MTFVCAVCALLRSLNFGWCALVENTAQEQCAPPHPPVGVGGAQCAVLMPGMKLIECAPSHCALRAALARAGISTFAAVGGRR